MKNERILRGSQWRDWWMHLVRAILSKRKPKMRAPHASNRSMKLLPALLGLGLGLLLGRWTSSSASPSYNFVPLSLTEKAAEHPLWQHFGRHCKIQPPIKALVGAAGGAEAASPHFGSLEAPTLQKSLGVVLARHNENTSWVYQLQQQLQAAQPSLKGPVMISMYQTPGTEVEGTATLAQLTEAEGAAAAAATSLEGAGQLAAAGAQVRHRPTIMNRGHEAMAFLSAIIDSFNSSTSLPDLMLFMHAHRHSNHTYLTPDWAVRRLAQRPGVELPLGYMPVQCREEPPDWNVFFPSDPNATEPGFKRELLHFILQGWEEEFGRWLGPLPARLLAPPNAEFVASREAILRRPLAFYVAARRWLMSTSLRSFLAAMVLEYLWALIFTGEAVFWVSQEECMCRLYSACLEGVS